MPSTRIRPGRRPSRRAVRALAPLIVGVAAGCCASACGSQPAATTSGVAVASSRPASPGTWSTAPGTSAGSGHRTPGAVLADWIHQVAADNRAAACNDMREPEMSAQRSAADCMSAAGKGTFTALHASFAADGITAATAISVTPQVKAANATASGSQVRIAGTTLDSLMTAHGTGVKPGQVDIGFELARIAGAWYVTGMNLDF